MKTLIRTTVLVAGCFVLATSSLHAQQRFSELVGPLRAQPVPELSPLPIPYITWGGDVATFHANGGLATGSGTIFQQLGLNIRLQPGDDFVQQVKDYVEGKTPFIRGTMRMLGQASEVLGADTRTKPVVILQLSWSAGDHLVAREKLRTLNDLRGTGGKKVRIACQQGGPHVGLLYDSLDAAKIRRDEVEVVWTKELTGAKGPAQLFRDDASVDACCVITPDLIGLTGGIESVGTGAEGTVAGAHMLNSTQQMSRSIADVYAVRSDWYEKHRETVEKFVAGYLQATQQVVALRKSFEDTGALDTKYRQVLTMAQSIFGKEVLPTLEVDAHGLLMDCNFVGLPGQFAFFEDRGNLTGFEPMMAKSLDLATGWGYASSRFGFDPPGLDLLKIAKLAGLEYVRPKAGGGRFSSEGIEDFPDSASLDERTIVSFTINFEPNEQQFSADRYGAEFNRAIQTAATFGNAVVVIRGHADPTKTLVEMVRAGQEKGIIKQSGTQGNYSYFLNGKPFDLTQTAQVVRLLQSGAFETKEHQPLRTAQAALNLSVSRAEAVKLSIVEFAKRQGVNLDESQIKPTGAGIAEPLIAKPTNMADARQNMRVDFRIIRVPAEALKESDFDL